MKTLSLQARIERSRKAVAAYPEWVKSGARFQGGGVVRDHSEMRELDREKVVKVMENI